MEQKKDECKFKLISEVKVWAQDKDTREERRRGGRKGGERQTISSFNHQSNNVAVNAVTISPPSLFSPILFIPPCHLCLSLSLFLSHTHPTPLTPSIFLYLCHSLSHRGCYLCPISPPFIPLSVSSQILLNFHLSVASTDDLETSYTLILQPERPPKITFSTL